MKGKNKQEWIEKGYFMISEQGFKAISVESLARLMNKNKSSFYHYFGNWETYEESLLDHHYQLSKPFAEKVAKCETIIPDIANLFIEHRTDIFFHKQLRIHRTKPHFQQCFESVFKLFEDAVLDKWSAFLGMNNQSFLASRFLVLLSENFLLQITHDQYNFDWLKNYFLENAKLMQNLNVPPR